jgi:hypothetical protein
MIVDTLAHVYLARSHKLETSILHLVVACEGMSYSSSQFLYTSTRSSSIARSFESSRSLSINSCTKRQSDAHRTKYYAPTLHKGLDNLQMAQDEN